MAFRVEISPRACRDFDAIATVIGEGSSLEAARKWFLAVHAETPVERVRVLLYGRKNRSHKIYFCVPPDTQSNGIVSVLHVGHWRAKV
jgi:plasmid stabilization system protein ParE